jgi:hypothetical protein
MSYQVVENFYLMGPAGRMGAHNFRMTRGFIFECERRYKNFFDAFIWRGRLRRTNLKPTHMFKEGDFRPIKNFDEFGEEIGSLRADARALVGDSGLPKSLQKMSKTWLGKQKRDRLMRICGELGFNHEGLQDLTRSQMIRMILNAKEQALDPLPPPAPTEAELKAAQAEQTMTAWGDEDLVFVEEVQTGKTE